MSFDSEFARCYDHGKPWEHQRPGAKPILHRAGPKLFGCMSCRVLFRNDDEWMRHVKRTNYRHSGAVGIGWVGKHRQEWMADD